jgi:hypothetical protein
MSDNVFTHIGNQWHNDMVANFEDFLLKKITIQNLMPYPINDVRKQKVRTIVFDNLPEYNERKLTVAISFKSTYLDNSFFNSIVTVGLSIRNPEAPYSDENMGKVIAKGRAEKNKGTTNSFKIATLDNELLVNSFFAEAVANSVYHDFKRNPEKYIAALNSTKNKK